MNIIQLVVSNSFGGVEGHICTLIKMMSGSGYNFTIVCNSETEQQFRNELDGYDVNIVPFQLWPSPSTKVFLNLIRFIRNSKPDIVHCHLYSAMRIGSVAAKLANHKIKVIETIHIEELWRKGFKKILFNTVDSILGALFVDHYIGVSKAVSEAYHREKRVSQKKMSVIHNTAEFPTGTITKKQFSGTIGFLGRLEDQKGVDILISALSKLNKYNNNWNLVIGGTGSLEEPRKDQVSQLNLSDNVTFLGNVTDKDQFFNMIDIFVLPSRFEGFPLVLLEAGMYNKPVVATNVSGTPEIIFDNVTGLLVEKDDPTQLSKAIDKLLDDQLRISLAFHLHSHVVNELSPSKYVQKMNNFYDSVISNKGGQYENSSSNESVTLSCEQRPKSTNIAIS